MIQIWTIIRILFASTGKGGEEVGRSREKKPTLAQKKYIKAAGLEPKDWLVRVDAWDGMVLVHRSTRTTRLIKKEPTGSTR